MPSWPENIPQYFNTAGYSEEPADNAIRTPMDTGDIKIRRRFTGQYDIISGSLDMTAAQFETFKAFWQDDLKDGSLAFIWVHPTTRASAQFKPMTKYRAPVFGVDNRRVQVQFVARGLVPAITPAKEILARSGFVLQGRLGETIIGR